MATMLTGVEMYRRRRTHSQQHLHDHDDHTPSYTSILDPPMMTTTSTIDDAAVKARQRLEERLGYFRHSRPNRVQANEGRGIRDNHNNNDQLVSRLLGRQRDFHYFHFRIHNNNTKLKGQLCVICLEDFHEERQVMELLCSHKYHSKCLLPWLADHPNCPSCRTPVQ
ncbi:unnamed protein product [Camellia sinensis]